MRTAYRGTRSGAEGGAWGAVGAVVAHCREQARLTREGLAALTGVSLDTLVGVEQGRLPLGPDRAARFDEILGTGGVLTVLTARTPPRERAAPSARSPAGAEPAEQRTAAPVRRQADAGREPAGREREGAGPERGAPARARDLPAREREAVSIQSYESLVVPALLRTRAYDRALFACRYPAVGGDAARRWDEIRRTQQAVLERERPAVCHVVLEEGVLRRQVGGPAVMREQLRHLLDRTASPHLSFQVMPTERAPHACLTGPLTLLETFRHERLAYLGTHGAGVLVEDPDEVGGSWLAFGMLRSQALSVDESARFVRTLLGDA